MKIGFIIYPAAVINGDANGIRSQAITWKNILTSNGQDCILIDSWQSYDWNTFDAIHIFGYDLNLYHFAKALFLKNSNLFLSPIIDSNTSYFLYKLSTYNGLQNFRLYSHNYVLNKSLKYFKSICTRSIHESKYLSISHNLNPKKLHHIPISYSIDIPRNIEQIINHKEEFCFHLSSIYQPRKNVVKLIKAAIKYDFNLLLGGNIGSPSQYLPIFKAIKNSANIKVLGYLTMKELINLYTKAKVFALPSLNEGIGIAALDASIYGCNIAITNIRGPKEYYPKTKTVALVDPNDIDCIGQNIVRLMQTPNTTEVYNHITNKYSSAEVYLKLINMYSVNP